MDGAIGVTGLDGLVREQVYEHVFAHPDREVGGVLVGRLGRGGDGPLVTAAIAALSADERGASLTFTQDTWEQIHRSMTVSHPHDEIVGWYHSHPGFGVYLSEPDVFIHRHFFGDPSQVALVIDPLQGSEGVFGWKGDELTCWYERPTQRAASGAEPSAHRAPLFDGLPLAALACAALLGVLLGLGLWEGVLRQDDARPSERPAAARPIDDRLPVTTNGPSGREEEEGR